MAYDVSLERQYKSPFYFLNKIDYNSDSSSLSLHGSEQKVSTK